MGSLFDAFWRALAYCLHPRVLALSLLPLLVTGVIALGASLIFWEPAVAAVHAMLQALPFVDSMLQWLAQLAGAGFRTLLEQIIVVALAIPLIVAFVLVLVGIWSTPAAVAMVSRRRFAGLERRHGGSWWKGLAYALGCTVAALFMVLVTLPLWLVPPLALVLPPLIWGWLTAKVMGFDALAEHATAAERAAILQAHRWPLLLMGIVVGFLCGVPSLVWTISPLLLFAAPFVMIVCVWLYSMIFTFAALWFTHYALTALELLRVAEARATSARAPLAAAGGAFEEARLRGHGAAADRGLPDDPLAGPRP